MTTRSQPRSDAELVRAISEHDRSALHELYERHEAWLVVRLSRRCADRQVVEEVIQDLFVTVWKSADRYEGSGEVAAWLWGIAIRRLLQRLRPRRPLLERLRSQPRTDQPSAEDHALRALDHGDLGDALAALSPDLRAVVQATVLDGLTTDEASTLLGIPSGTVKTRMMRARRILKEALQ